MNTKEYIESGKAKFEREDYKGALDDFTEAIQAQPVDDNWGAWNGLDNAYYWRGKTQRRLENFESAIADLTNAINASCALADYFGDNNRKHIASALSEYYQFRGLMKERLKDYKAAIEDYDKSIKHQYTNSKSYLFRANAKVALGYYAEAIGDYGKSYTEVEFAEDFFNRGKVKLYAKDYIGAKKDYDKAIEMEPNLENVCFCGQIKAGLRDYEGAIADFAKAIEQNPDSAEIYFNRGKVKFQLDDYMEAIDDFNQAIKINSKYAEAYYYRGMAKSALKDEDGAEEDYFRVIEIIPIPSSAQDYNIHGMANAALDEHKSALEDYKKILDRDNGLAPDYADVYNNRGKIYEHLGKLTEAIEDYSQAIRKNPKHDEAYFNRGKVKYSSKDYIGAVQDYAKAIEINSNVAEEAYYYSGRAQLVMENYTAAIGNFSAAIEINSNYAEAYYYRGKAKEVINRHKLAVSDFNKAKELNPNIEDLDNEDHADNDQGNPKDVTEFMSLFNQRDGLKYLTHDFDEGGAFDIEAFLLKAKDVFTTHSQLSIPKDLWVLLNQFAFSTAVDDFQNSPIASGWSTPEWIEWSKKNGLHPIRNDKFKQIINDFRQATRIESPMLEELVNDIVYDVLDVEKFEIETKDLSKANFYTHVGSFKAALEAIFEEIKNLAHSDDKRKITIRYERDTMGDYFIRKVLITCHDYVSPEELNVLLKEWETGKIKSKLQGYCHWSVETMIEDKPVKINILRDKRALKSEKLETAIEGFTHILTFYYK
ncbi:hypothetical protein AGMMS4957_08600 [Bacteroidia bacterium]|nr:hypothetical protein AGMMS4957_08600 [Bacteroidia bacterium]